MRLLAAIILTVISFGVVTPAKLHAQDSVPSDAVQFSIEFQALLDEYIALPKPPDRATQERVAEWRAAVRPLLDGLIDRLTALGKRAGDPPDLLLVTALCHAKRANLLIDERRELDDRYARASEGRTAEEVLAAEPDLVRRRSEVAKRVADEYSIIAQALRGALARADVLRTSREGNLILGVVLAQSALVEDRAIDAADAAGQPATLDPARMRVLLDESESLLSQYLAATPRENGLEWVRGKFYLGVVQYRRSLVLREVGKAYATEVDPTRLAEFSSARETFSELSDPAAVLAILRPHADAETQRASPAGRAFDGSGFRRQSGYSYEAVSQYYAATANLYLALISAIDPSSPFETRREAATRFLDRANELDSYQPSADVPAFSLTSNTVPTSRTRILSEFERASQTVERRPLNDLTITLGATGMYDTNVILLGRNTEPPLDRQRKRDIRLGTSLRLNYIADLDVIDPGNQYLKRWQLEVEGRVSPTWNARIPEFNEQFYGASLNLRYELLGAGESETVNGVYLHTRYDYDYVLLENNGFLRVNRVRPSVQVLAFNEFVDASVFFGYEDRNYLEELPDERFDRDGNYFSWGVEGRFEFDRLNDKWNADGLWGEMAWGGYAPKQSDSDWRRPVALLAGLEFNTNSTQGDEFDYDSRILTAGLDFPLPLGIDAGFRAIWEWQDYRHGSLVDRGRRAREDFVQEYGFRAERKFFLNPKYSDDFEYTEPLRFDRVVMTLFGEIRFTLDDSNVRDRLGQSIYEYNRIIYSAGVRLDIN